MPYAATSIYPDMGKILPLWGESYENTRVRHALIPRIVEMFPCQLKGMSGYTSTHLTSTSGQTFVFCGSKSAAIGTVGAWIAKNSVQAPGELFALAPDRLGGLGEFSLFVGVELQLDDLFNAPGPQPGRHP